MPNFKRFKKVGWPCQVVELWFVGSYVFVVLLFVWLLDCLSWCRLVWLVGWWVDWLSHPPSPPPSGPPAPLLDHLASEFLPSRRWWFSVVAAFVDLVLAVGLVLVSSHYCR